MTKHTEQLALKRSLAATIVVAIFGITYGLYLNAEAILLDGFFSILSMGMTGLSLLTSYLIQRPEDNRFQFGYAHLEPLMNTINGLVILAVCTYSLANAVSDLLSGGREVPFDRALYYAVPITFLCLALHMYESWVAKRIESELLRVDAKEWLVDAILTFTLTCGFVMGWYLETSGYKHLAPYVDPALVALMATGAMVIPLIVLKRNMRQVLMVAPSEMANRLPRLIKQALAPYQVSMVASHVAKFGRRYDIEINVLLDERSSLYNAQLEKLDEVRNHLSEVLKLDPEEHWISITFTQDSDWL